jgi:hypothetical protein
LLDAETGKELRRFARQQGEIRALALSPDGRTLALLQVVSDHSLELTLWQGEAKDPSAKTVIPVTDSGYGATLMFAPDGRYLGVVFAETSLFEVATGRRIQTFKPGWGCLVPGSKAASLFPEGAERQEAARQPLVNVRKAVLTRLEKAGVGTVRVLAEAVSADGRRLATLVSGHPDPTLALWDLDAGKLLCQVPVSLTAQAGGWAKFSADGSTLLAWDQQGVCVVDFATGRERLVLRGVQPVNEGLSVPVLAHDGSLLAVGGSEGVRLWRVPR